VIETAPSKSTSVFNLKAPANLSYIRMYLAMETRTWHRLLLLLIPTILNQNENDNMLL